MGDTIKCSSGKWRQGSGNENWRTEERGNKIERGERVGRESGERKGGGERERGGGEREE